MSDTDTTTTVTQEPGPPPSVTVDRRSGAPWWVLPSLTALAMVVFVIGLGLAYMLPEQTLFNVALGAAIGMATTAMNFWFGSSKSSQDKDATMAASTAKKDDTIQANSAALAVSAPVNGAPP